MSATGAKGGSVAGTEQAVFSVNGRHGRIWFRLGFCEGYMTLPETVIPFRAFKKAVIHVDQGVIECRVIWHPPRGMRRSASAMRLHRWETWMAVEMDAVLEAVRTCEILSDPLPPGFRRRFD
jgi:hypothetical protein